MKDAVDRELDMLEDVGVLEKVTHSDWAVPKSDGTVRLCGDYKVTVNLVLDVDQYLLPCPEDLMSSITGGLKFSKLDLTSAYQQMPLDEASREYITIMGCIATLACLLELQWPQPSFKRQWTVLCKGYSTSSATLMTSWLQVPQKRSTCRT